MRNKIRTSQKVLAMALAASVLTPVIASPIPTHAESVVNNVVLKDIKGHWAETSINSAIKKGYVAGFSNGTFKPNQSVTNAEFIKMLVTALNPKETFNNTTGSGWYESYVNEAEKIGLIINGEFTDKQMNTYMKRSELAKLSARAVGESTTNEKEWFYLATTKGLINGVDSKGTLNIDRNMTRAQAVTVIERVLQVNNGAKLAVDNKSVNNAKTLATIGVMDITGHWAEKSIKAGIKKGYVAGYSDGTYKPDKSVTNAEFVKMLTIALNPNKNYEVISGGNWHQPYMNDAKATGLIKGTELSAVNNQMIRLDLAKLGARAIGQDTNDNKKWMYIATSAGLINGKDSKGTLAENGTMTRAQAATLIERVLKINNGETLPKDKYAIANAEIVWHNTNIFTMIPNWFKPNTIDRYSVSDSKLVSKSPDGNVISTAKKLVVIDTDDKNDPNWNLVSNKVLNSYDAYKDVVTYLDVKKSNGYIIVSVNDLQIKDTSKLQVSALRGAYFDVSFANRTEDTKLYPLVTKGKNGEIIADRIMLKKGQAQKVYDYTTGYYISKDYPIAQDEFVQIYFRGIMEWGDINGSKLYDVQYQK